MFAFKRKFKILVFLLISIIGFATGINFFNSIDNISIAKGCFEFGLYEFLGGTEYYNIFLSLSYSLLKNSIVMFIGIISWWIFPIIFLNVFGLGFKMGIVVSFVFGTLKFNGFFECVVMALIAIVVLFLSVLFAYELLERRIYHGKIIKFDNSDLEFIKKHIKHILIFAVIIISLYFASSLLNLKLYGFFNTFL